MDQAESVKGGVVLVDRQSVENVFKGLKAEFNNASDSVKTTWIKIAMLVESTTAIEEYPWLDNMPQMRKWAGERVIVPVRAHSYSLRNQVWESTIPISVDDLEDERIGMYATRARAAGSVAAAWPDRMIYDAVNESFESHGHDNVPFIGGGHALNGDVGPGEFSNMLTVPLDSSSLANAVASFGAAQTALMKMKAQDGALMGLMPGVLLVPPALKAQADILTGSETLGSKDPNPYKDAAEVVCSPRLTSDKRWWLMADDTAGMKPFIWQERKKAEIQMVSDPEDHYVFTRREVLLGVTGRGVAGYGLPQLVVGSDPA